MARCGLWLYKQPRFNLPGSAAGSRPNWVIRIGRRLRKLSTRVSDCRSGQCFPGYLYFNGYIPANRINVARRCPGDSAELHAFIDTVWPTPADGGSPSDPNSRYYETNNVFVPLKNGTSQLVPLDTGLNPFRNQAVKGRGLRA